MWRYDLTPVVSNFCLISGNLKIIAVLAHGTLVKVAARMVINILIQISVFAITLVHLGLWQTHTTYVRVSYVFNAIVHVVFHCLCMCKKQDDPIA